MPYVSRYFVFCWNPKLSKNLSFHFQKPPKCLYISIPCALRRHDYPNYLATYIWI